MPATAAGWPGKGVFVDHQAWRDPATAVAALTEARLATTTVNLFWPEWEAAPVPAGRCGGDRHFVYEGACFRAPAGLDRAVAALSDRGVRVIGIVIGTPAWAARPAECGDGWCPPEDRAAFRRFVRMIATRYRGRIGDFVIGNEVTTRSYFRVACPSAGALLDCRRVGWVERYATYFTDAQDAIQTVQPSARALVSIGNAFFPPAHAPLSAAPEYAGALFLRAFAKLVGRRPWYVAAHPYSRALGDPRFSPRDYEPERERATDFRPGRLTMGNVGALAGWLHRNLPGSPAARSIFLTEQGFSSSPLAGQYESDEPGQSAALCRALRNVLATPGIEAFVYHRLIDHPDEAALAGRLGLWRDGTPASAKPAWRRWADSDTPATPECGFELLPATRLQTSREAGTGYHWTSSRVPPDGYAPEGSGWRLLRDAPATAATMLFECGASDAAGRLRTTRITADPGCAGPKGGRALLPLGPVGYIPRGAGPGRHGLYACVTVSRHDHFVSEDPGCAGGVMLEKLGFAARWAVAPRA